MNIQMTKAVALGVASMAVVLACRAEPKPLTDAQRKEALAKCGQFMTDPAKEAAFKACLEKVREGR